jgi:hypothetical protein
MQVAGTVAGGSRGRCRQAARCRRCDRVAVNRPSGGRRPGPGSGRRQPTAFQGPAGQLHEGIGVRWPPVRASSAAAGRANGSNTANRILPASGPNSPSTATIPSQVGDNHTPRRRMAPLGLAVSPLGVGDLQEIAQGTAELRRVEVNRSLQQDWFGLGGDLVGELAGAVDHHPGMSRRDIPSDQRRRGLGQGTTEQRPPGPDRVRHFPNPVERNHSARRVHRARCQHHRAWRVHGAQTTPTHRAR